MTLLHLDDRALRIITVGSNVAGMVEATIGLDWFERAEIEYVRQGGLCLCWEFLRDVARKGYLFLFIPAYPFHHCP